MTDDTLVYMSFVMLGAANLVPWQANLALADYYAARYSSNVMEFAFPAASTSVLLATCAVLVVIGSRLSFDIRIATTTLLMSAAILVVPVVDLLLNLGVISTSSGFWVTILSVAVNAMCSASAQNALYALASVVGDTATQALQMGNGMVGLLAVILRVLTMIGLNPTASVWIFCLLSSGSLLLSLGAYNSVTKSDRCGESLRTHERRRAQRSKSGDSSLKDPMLAAAAQGGVSILSTIRLVWIESSCVLLVFLVCLTCFPGLTTSITSTSWNLGRHAPVAIFPHSPCASFHQCSSFAFRRVSPTVTQTLMLCSPRSWYPLALVAAYNFADFIGKSLPSKLRLFGSSTLPYYVLLHLCFIPAFLLLLQACHAPCP